VQLDGQSGSGGEHLRGVAAVDRDRDIPVRVFVENDLARSRVAERARGGCVVTLARERELEPSAGDDVHAVEILTGQVELHVAESVDVEDCRTDDAVPELRFRQIEPDQCVGREGRPEILR
jgi:hypothetical protein